MTVTNNVVINKWIDLIDRVGWTAIQAAAGAGIVALTNGDLSWRGALTAVGVATGIAALKVVVAQNTGNDNLGAAVPGKEVLQVVPTVSQKTP